jgi:hypothetical protein
VSFTTGSYPPFANPHIAELAAQLDASLGVANGLSQYLNQSLGEAISANAQIINAVAGAPNVTLVTLDHASICYTTAGPLNVTLPPIGNVGRMCEIIKASNDANTVTVTLPAGVTFVDGTTTFVLYNQNDYVDIICNPVAASWLIRGYRQRGLQNNGGFSGLAGCASVSDLNVNQTIPSGIVTTMTINTKQFDTGLPTPYWNSATPNIFTIPATGIYEVDAYAAFLQSTATSGIIVMYLVVQDPLHGQIYAGGNVIPVPTNGAVCAITMSNMFHFTSGSLISVGLYQVSGIPMTLYANSGTNFNGMSINQIG